MVSSTVCRPLSEARAFHSHGKSLSNDAKDEPSGSQDGVGFAATVQVSGSTDDFRLSAESQVLTPSMISTMRSKQVIREARVLLSANNNVSDGMIASNFGIDATGITIIGGEDPKETEVNSWIPVAKLAASDRMST